MDTKLKDYLKLNKNILIAFVASFAVSSYVADHLSDQEAHLNTTYTLFADYGVYFSVFGALFYLDNKRRFSAGNPHLKRNILKLVTSFGIGEVVYTVARWLLQYYFLIMGYDAYLSSMISQLSSTALYLITMNLSAKAVKLFKD